MLKPPYSPLNTLPPQCLWHWSFYPDTSSSRIYWLILLPPSSFCTDFSFSVSPALTALFNTASNCYSWSPFLKGGGPCATSSFSGLKSLFFLSAVESMGCRWLSALRLHWTLPLGWWEPSWSKLPFPWGPLHQSLISITTLSWEDPAPNKSSLLGYKVSSPWVNSELLRVSWDWMAIRLCPGGFHPFLPQVLLLNVAPPVCWYPSESAFQGTPHKTLAFLPLPPPSSNILNILLVYYEFLPHTHLI